MAVTALPRSAALLLNTMSDEYLAVLQASYDYDAQGEDEIPIKENQIVFLLERTDEE